VKVHKIDLCRYNDKLTMVDFIIVIKEKLL